MNSKKSYVPALGLRFLTPLYDSVLRITMGDPEFKRVFLEQIDFQPGEAVLDLGCGTGTLTELVCERIGSNGHIYGVDIDEDMLAHARARIKDSPTEQILKIGNATDIPLPDQSVDRVVSSLLFHHLNRDQKLSALKEANRVLRIGGRLNIVDWGEPSSASRRLGFYAVQLLDGFDTTTDNVVGIMPELIGDAQFQDVVVRPCMNTLLGSLQCFHASR